MTLESWYYASGIASCFIAFGGLIGLIVYAIDNKRLRIAAQQQLEAAIRPCVLLMEDADAGEQRATDETYLILKNVGVGVSLNVRWRYRKISNSGWVGCPALAPGDINRPAVHLRDVLNGHGVECEFSSLSDAKYRVVNTCGVPAPSLEMQHKVERVKG